MKRINNYIVFIGFILNSILLSAQVNPGSDCSTAGCSTSGSYQNLTGVSSMGQYSCLYSTPNPNWLAIGIGSSGSVHLILTQTSSNNTLIDVDFALYGPYTSVSAGCPITGSTPTVDCSYSASATEYIDIPNAIAGQVYILLITNYNGQSGTISIQPNTSTPSTGSTNCSINFSATTTSTSATCGQSNGTATVTASGGYSPYTYQWNDPAGQTTQTATGLAPGTYTVTVTSSPNPTTNQTVNPTTATVVVTNQTANYSGTTTQSSCSQINDGTATANFSFPYSSSVTASSYQWNDPLNQTTQTAIGLAPGSYSCNVTLSNGCTGTVNVTVTQKPDMITTMTSQDVTCYTKNDGIATVQVTNGNLPLSYSWTGSASTSNTANDLLAGIHTVTVTDNKGCTTTHEVTIDQPDPLKITFLTPDSSICPEDSIELTVIGTGGSSTYLYNWTSNGISVGNTQTIKVDPNTPVTQYCVNFSEQCGSPSVDSCMTVYFHTPIVPDITPDEYSKCEPGFFEFTNTSENAADIASLYIQYSNNQQATELGTDSTSMSFLFPMEYDAILTATSVYGCIYTDTLYNLVKVLSTPTADFTFTNNPATIFETTVQMQNRSSIDATHFEWSSPGSSPTYSYSENPTFVFPEGIIAKYPVTLYVTTDAGCTDSITLTMNVIQDVLFYAPNAFTPDGDEFNQQWKISIAGLDEYSFTLYIFNRWGEIIWENHDPNVSWDGTYNGKLVESGVYMWRASAKDVYSGKKYEFNGIINVIR